MFRIVCRILLGAGLALVVAAPPASAQVYNEFTFKTTFPFMVGRAEMPAGSYTVRPSETGVGALLEIEGEHHSAVFFGENAGRPAVDPNRSEVTFDRTGDHYVLSRIWDESTHEGAEVIPAHGGAKTVEATSTKAHH